MKNENFHFFVDFFVLECLETLAGENVELHEKDLTVGEKSLLQ